MKKKKLQKLSRLNHKPYIRNIQKSSLDVPFLRLKCTGTSQSSGYSSSVVRLILTGAKGRCWMMLEKQAIRHAPNTRRACKLVLFPPSCILFRRPFLHSSFVILERLFRMLANYLPLLSDSGIYQLT